MLSVGLSALACALILVIGAVLLVTVGAPDRSARADDSATTLDLSAGTDGGATPKAKSGSTGATTQKRTAPTTSKAPAPAQGGSGSGAAAPAPAARGNDGGRAAAAPEQNAPAGDSGEAAQVPTDPPAQDQPAPEGPAQPSAGELDSAVHIAMDSGANRGERAAALEAGERGLGVLDAIDGVIKASGYGFTFKVLDPVRMDGDTAHATLQMSVAGNGSRNQDLTWVWVDGRWKLSNGSVCALAGLALLPCSL